MIQRKVEILNKYNEKLIGIEEFDSKNFNNKIVILIHGFGGDNDEYGLFPAISKKLVRLGYKTYRFNFSGCDKSEGDFAETTISKLVLDLEYIKNYVEKSNPNFKEINSISFSMGNSVVIASQLKFKSYIFMNSFENVVSVISKIFPDELNYNGISRRKSSRGNDILLNKEFWKNAQSYNYKKLISKVSESKLFITTTKDEVVPVEEMEELYDSCDNNKSKLIVTNSKHDLLADIDLVLNRIVDFYLEFN